MEIFLVRHAIAMDRLHFILENRDDSQRPLTSEGKQKFKKIARRLSDLIQPVDVIVSSPYMRARETTEILAQSLEPDIPILMSPALTPSAAPEEFAEWSKKNLNKSHSRLVLVGHEPHLGLFATWLLFGKTQQSVSSTKIAVKKGGCLWITTNNSTFKPSCGYLNWALTPKSLLGFDTKKKGSWIHP